MRPPCFTCGERPAMPSRKRCSRCYNATPYNRAARARYRATEHGAAVTIKHRTQHNKKRIFIGRRYHSLAATPETAAAVNTFIKERMRALKG